MAGIPIIAICLHLMEAGYKYNWLSTPAFLFLPATPCLSLCHPPALVSFCGTHFGSRIYTILSHRVLLLRPLPHVSPIYLSIYLSLCMCLCVWLDQNIYFAPLFNTFTKLADGPLRTRITDLARRLEFPVQEIQVPANACNEQRCICLYIYDQPEQRFPFRCRCIPSTYVLIRKGGRWIEARWPFKCVFSVYLPTFLPISVFLYQSLFIDVLRGSSWASGRARRLSCTTRC